jgi:hypothetical protein
LKPVLQPELIELYKSGRNELKCGFFAILSRGRFLYVITDPADDGSSSIDIIHDTVECLPDLA